MVVIQFYGADKKNWRILKTFFVTRVTRGIKSLSRIHKMQLEKFVYKKVELF